MRLSWKIYGFLYTLMVLLGAWYSLLPNSAPNVYYKILISFNKVFLCQYIFHYLGAFLDIFSLVPLFLFVFQKRWLPKLFWKVFFYAKIFLIFMANDYEANLLATFWQTNKLLTLASILTGLIIILPSYIALYLYAFRRK